jgi:glucan 1,3-beta-glucosidase
MENTIHNITVHDIRRSQLKSLQIMIETMKEGGKDGNGHASTCSLVAQQYTNTTTGIAIGVILLILIIAITVGVSISKKKDTTSMTSSTTTTSTAPSTASLSGISPDSIPNYAQGTYSDPFTWYDTTDFNVTFTNATVGGLSVMGLNSQWNDNTQANKAVPGLKDKWEYGSRVIRGINLGGWLSIEPFITPSFFDQFTSSQKVIDEYTLCQTLGPTQAKAQIEKHYATFITEADFIAIQAAGFDHVRIPYSYWAVTTYPGDPYLAQVSWRYLLRGLEWARKHGLRVNLDLHALPGSQNGWNHSGRQGAINWINGTDGTLNAQRSLDIHTQLTTFFAQPRYANLVTMYGLANEPRMVALPTADVLAWTSQAIAIVRASGMPSSTIIVIGDGFLGLANWQGLLAGQTNVLLDVHQYVVFNSDQLALAHSSKIDFACTGWAQQTNQSMDPATGFGNFLCGEWSQADTDCVRNLNNVGVGSRWEGTLNMGAQGASVLTPTCPTRDSPRCDCTSANADASTYSAAYKQWLSTFAQAQMQSYELGWGW